jgi:hypothetical protein
MAEIYDEYANTSEYNNQYSQPSIFDNVSVASDLGNPDISPSDNSGFFTGTNISGQNTRLSQDEIAQRKAERLSKKSGAEDDSSLMINAKRAYNVVNDLWGGKDLQANLYGRKLNLDNKTFEEPGVGIEQSSKNRQELIDQYNSAQDDPNAEHRVYHLRLLDGYDYQGKPLYTYKTGVAKNSAADRYRRQFIEQGYDILDEKGFTGAEDWENKWHGNRANIENRTYGSGYNEQGKKIKDIAQLGSGYTEVYNTDAFGFNQDSNRLAQNKYNSEMLMKAADKASASGESGILRAAAAGGVRALASTGDFILDVLTPGNNTLLDEAKQQENVDKLVGYDRRDASKTLNEAGGKWKKGDYFGAIGKVLSKPEIAAESLATMLEMAIGFGKFSILGKLGAELTAAKAAGKADEVASISSKIAKANTSVQRGIQKVAENAGLLSVVGEQTNNDLEERKANNGGVEPTMAETLSVGALNFALFGLDRIAFDKITGIEGGKVALKNAFGSADAIGKKKILLGIAEQAGALTAAGLGEAAQEYTQTWGQILGTQLGTQKNEGSFSKIISSEENIDEVIQSTLAGFAGGTQFRAGADALSIGGKGLAEGAKAATTFNSQIGSGKVDESVASDVNIAEDAKTATDLDFNTQVEEKINNAINSISSYEQNKTQQSLFDANDSLNSIDESAVLDERLKERILNTRKDLLDQVRKMTKKTIYDGDEKSINSLGSDQENLDYYTRENNFRQLLSEMKDSGDFSNESIKKNIESLGRALGLDSETIKSVKDEQETFVRARKDINTVEKEVVSDEFKGYESYFNNLRNAIERQDSKAITSNVSKISNFHASQESKFNKLSEAAQEVERDVKSRARELVESGASENYSSALQSIVDRKNTQVPVTYSEFSSDFQINPGDIAKNLLDSDSRTGVLQTLDYIGRSVDAISNLSKLYDVKLSKIDDTTVDEDVKKSDKVDRIKRLAGFLTKHNKLAKKFNGVKIEDIENARDRDIVSEYRQKREELEGLRKTTSTNSSKKNDTKEYSSKSSSSLDSSLFTKEEQSVIDSAFDRFKSGKETGLKKLYNSVVNLGDDNKLNALKKEIVSINKDIKKYSDSIKEAKDTKASIAKENKETKKEIKKEKEVDNKKERKEENNTKESSSDLASQIKTPTFEITPPSSDNIFDVYPMPSYEESTPEQVVPYESSIDVEDVSATDDRYPLSESFPYEEHSYNLSKELVSIKKDIQSTDKQEVLSTSNRVDILNHNLESFQRTIDSFIDDINKMKDEKKFLSAEQNNIFSQISVLNQKIKKANDTLRKSTTKEKARIAMDSPIKLARMIIERIFKLLDGFHIDKFRLLERKTKITNRIKELNNSIEAIYENKIAPFKEQIKDIKNDLEGTAHIESIIGQKTITENGKVIAKNGTSVYAGIGKIKGQHINPLNIVEPSRSKKNRLSSLALGEDPISVAVMNYSNDATTVLGNTLAYANNEGLEKLKGQNGPGRGLVFSKIDGEISINKNVATAIALAADEYISFMSSKLIFNTNEEIANMLGVDEQSLSPDIIAFWRNKGKFKKVIASELGQNILSNLSLKTRRDIDIETSVKIKMDLGQMALYYMESKGYIEPLKDTIVSSSDYKKYGGKDVYESAFAYNDPNDINLELNGQNTTMIQLSKNLKSDKKLPSDKSSINKISALYNTVKEDIGFEGNRKGYIFASSSSRKDKTFTIRKNDVTEVPSASVDTLNVLSKEEYELNTDALNDLLSLGKDKVLELLGYTNEDYLNDLSFNDRESAIARNRELTTSLDDLINLGSNIDSGQENKFFFDWFFSRNGRFMMDSVTVNPQADKLHRFLVTPKAFASNIKIDSEKDMNIFKTAIAQAFGFAVDKKSTKKIYEFADVVLNSNISDLKKLFNNGKLKLNGIELEAEHLSHSIVGIQAVTAYQNAINNESKSFKTNLSVEFDAVTSGFILKLMQLPLSDVKKTKEWLAKGGIFIGGLDGISENDFERISSMNDEIDSGRVVDGYRTLAGGMIEPDDVPDSIDPLGLWSTLRKNKFLPDILEKVEVESDTISSENSSASREEYVVSKDGRALFKDPFMTFGYSAGMKSIKRHLGYKMIEAIPTKLLDGSAESNELIENILSKTSINLRDFKQMLRDKSIEDISINIGNGEQITLGQYLRNIIEDGYGNQVESILSTEFADMIEANETINNSFKMMFRAWKIKYDEAIQLAGGFGTITAEQELEIIKSLRDIFPLIKSPLGDGTRDGVAIVNTGIDTKYDYKYGAAQTALSNGSSPKVQSMIRQFEEAINSGAVIPIHYIDGSLMTNLLGKGGILGIHDAKMSSLNSALDNVVDYNTQVFNISKEYSLTNELLVSMRRVAKTMTEKQRSEIESIVTGFGKNKKSYSFDDIGKKLSDLDSVSKVAREELFNNDIKVMHMTALPGSEFINKQYKEKEKDRFLENETIEDYNVSKLGYGVVSPKSESARGINNANDVNDVSSLSATNSSGTEYVLSEDDTKRINDTMNKNINECEGL